MESTRTEILDYLFSAQTSAQQCEHDILLSSEKEIVYNLDYSSFFNGIWTKSEKKTLYDAVSGEFFEELVDCERAPYTPIITSITFLEVLETFYNEIEAQKARSRFIHEKIKSIHSNIEAIRVSPIGIDAHFPLMQAQVEAELAKLSDVTGRTLRGAAQRAARLLGKGGQVKGLGDVIGPSIRLMTFSQSEVNSLYNQMWDFRSSRDAHSDIEKREFRYMVDVINIYLTREINRTSNHRDVNYVSKANYTSHFCPNHGRSPLVPLFWLRAHRSDEFSNDIEQADFFRALTNNAAYAYKRFFSRHSLPSSTEMNYALLGNFNEMYMSQLRIFKERMEGFPNLHKDRLFTDHNYLRNTVEKNLSESERLFAKLYNDFGGVISDDLVERSGIDRLEHYRKTADRIRRKLGSG